MYLKPDCSLDADDAALAAMSRLNGTWAASKPKLMRCFFLNDAGRLQNRRLLECWEARRASRIKRSMAGQAGAIQRHGSTSIATTPHFDAFWQAWPAHSRKVNKPECAMRWKARELDTIADEIMAGLEAWKRSDDWAREGGKYIPGVLVWMNQNRWENAAANLREAGPSRPEGAPPREWEVARNGSAQMVWDAREAGESAIAAAESARAKWGRVPQFLGRDAVTVGIDLAMNNTRKA
jgi:uncharacterized protein YdaU (DUF1376 family)